MKVILQITTLLLLLINQTILSQQQQPSPALTSLVEAERLFARTSVEQGQREAFLAFFAADGVGFQPQPYNTKAVLSKQPPTPKPQPFILNWQPLYGDISIAGDLGFTTGPYTVEADNSATRHGIFFSVWQKQADKSWKVMADIGVPTPQAVAPLNTAFTAASHPPGKAMQSNKAELLALENEFGKALQTEGAVSAYRRFAASDARLHRVQLMPVLGQQAIASYLADKDWRITLTPAQAGIASSGDLGYVYGGYEAAAEKGYYLRVWRRGKSNKWELVADITNPLPQEAPARPDGATASTFTFTDVTKAAGIDFINYTSPDKKYIVESMGGGVAFIDFDNDGKLDIYLLNSFTVEGALANKPRPPAALYRNLGNGKFVDVAAQAGVADPGWAMGLTVGDYDNDGLDDLYVTCFGPNKLYRNLGNGKFADVTNRAGVGDARFSTGAAWGDYDRDGKLDLFVANYVDFNLAQLPEFGKGKLCLYRGIKVQCGPRGLPGAGDALYHNNGDGTFTEVSQKAGTDDPNGHYGLGVMWTDFDNDGWPDIIVANDATPNFAYRNNHDGTFTEMGLALGLAVNEDGIEQGSMGLSIADFNRDGRLDLVVTNFSDDYNTIYRNNADGTFTDVSRATKTADASMPYVGWGTKLFDPDNDGWLDLLVVNGHVYPQIEGAYPGGQYQQRMLFYRNLRNGAFSEIAAEISGAMTHRVTSRGAAFGDYDNDGDVDVIVNNLDGGPVLLRNDGGNKAGNWLMLKLTGTKSNRNAIGARVTVKAGGLTQIEELHGTESYLSHSDWRLHFGLGKAAVADEVIIQWPSGKVEKLAGVKANQVLKVTEK